MSSFVTDDAQTAVAVAVPVVQTEEDNEHDT